MLDLYDYPIMITREDVQNYLGVALAGIDGQILLNQTHEYIYDFLIYVTYNSDIKNRIIEKYRKVLEKPVKRALLAQLQYIYGNGGDIATWNGMMKTGQSADSKDVQEVLTKALSPKVINILKGAPVDLLYAGGER